MPKIAKRTALLLVLLAGACEDATPRGSVVKVRPRPAAVRDAAPPPPPVAVEAGTTPVAERVAVLGLLNKRNGITQDLTLRPGQAVRVGDVVVRLRTCETTAPYEFERLTGAFVQVDVEGSDRRLRRAFSGWLYKESPSLNVVEHPVYDVWPKSCAMTHPSEGPDTLDAPRSPPAGAVAAASSRSKAT